MRELIIFVDESGNVGLPNRHYLLTVVIHDQYESIADSLATYEGGLRANSSPHRTNPSKHSGSSAIISAGCLGNGVLWSTTCSRANVQKRWLTCMDGLFFSFISSPAEQDPGGGLRNKSADISGAIRSADPWAARRSERPWHEPPAYADRIGRSTFDSSYSRNRARRTTALSRACICESDGSNAGTSATGSKRESASAGT